MFGYIYKTTFPDGKVYIGQKQSGFFCQSYFGSGVYVKRYIKKYGTDDLKVEVIDWCESLEELNQKEIFYIKEYNSIMPNGYNIAVGGGCGNTFAGKSKEELNEIKEKMSKSRKGVPNLKNKKPCPEERKKKISETLKLYYNSLTKESRNFIYGKHHLGVKQSNEEREKRKKSLTGKKKPESFKIFMSKLHSGKIVSKETRDKQRLAKLGKIPKNKNKCCINKDGKNKYINKENIEYYFDNGWVLGGKPRK